MCKQVHRAFASGAPPASAAGTGSSVRFPASRHLVRLIPAAGRAVPTATLPLSLEAQPAGSSAAAEPDTGAHAALPWRGGEAEGEAEGEAVGEAEGESAAS